MRKGRLSSGYTIIELMIVLAVSSALLVSALLLIGNQQQKAQFNQSMHSTQSTIDQIINNVATGYYSRTTNLSCTKAGYGPKFANLISGRGASEDCIFIGRAIQLGLAGDETSYNIYNLAGLRLAGGQQVANIKQALPIAISTGTSTNNYGGFPDTTETHSFEQSFAVKSVQYTVGALTQPTSIIAFITDFPSTTGGNTDSSSRSVLLYAINNSVPLLDKNGAVDTINARDIGNNPINIVKADSVSVCFQGPTSFGILTIGGNNRQLVTDLKFTNLSPVPVECT